MVHDVQDSALSKHIVNGSVRFTYNWQFLPDSDKSPSSVVANINVICSMETFTK